MLEEDEEELDDETIQARVDASLAKIYSVTSTWLKPKKTPSAPKKDLEKELEGIMRRPSRWVLPHPFHCEFPPDTTILQLGSWR